MSVLIGGNPDACMAMVNRVPHMAIVKEHRKKYEAECDARLSGLGCYVSEKPLCQPATGVGSKEWMETNQDKTPENLQAVIDAVVASHIAAEMKSAGRQSGFVLVRIMLADRGDRSGDIIKMIGSNNEMTESMMPLYAK